MLIDMAFSFQPCSSTSTASLVMPCVSSATRKRCESRSNKNNNFHRYRRRSGNDSSDKKNNITAFKMILRLPSIILLLTILAIVTPLTNAALLQGCNFDETLCDEKEVCIPDGLFGQCYSDGESEVLKPLIIDEPLSVYEQELLRVELRRLADAGLNWPHAWTQCMLAYLKFIIKYTLPYDAQFCSVQDPNNIWTLIQEVQTVLAKESEARKALFEETLRRDGILQRNIAQNLGGIPIVFIDEEESKNAGIPAISAVGDATESDGSIGSADSQEESQLRPGANASDAFDMVIEQLRDRGTEKEKRSVGMDNIAIDLADNSVNNADEDYFALPSGILVAADADGSVIARALNANAAAETAAETLALESAAQAQQLQKLQGNTDLRDLQNLQELQRAQERTAAWNAWLTAVLATNKHGDVGGVVPLVNSNNGVLPVLTATEEKQLDDYVTSVLNNRNANLASLNDSQLEKLVAFINSMKVMLQKKSAQLRQKAAEFSAPEVEEVIPLTSQNNEKQLLLKKDAEKFDNADMGLSNTVHKIVKGGIQRVEGNRVYLKVNERKDSDGHAIPLSESQLTRLIDFLDGKIAAPNDLLFDEFAYENEQLSFRVSRIKFLPALQQIFEKLSMNDVYGGDENSTDDSDETKTEVDSVVGASPDVSTHNDVAPKKGVQATDVPVDSASDVAEAVYKRRRDIETLAGVEVDETGIGSGEDIVPVVGGIRRDWFFISAMAVCGVALVALAGVLAAQWIRARGASARADSKIPNTSVANLPEVIDYIEGKPAAIYEDLCRQRMSGQYDAMQAGTSGSNAPAPVGSKHTSSISSWPDDTYLQSCNLDISTGHVILSFLKDCLEKPDELNNQWSQLANYENITAEKRIAQRAENAGKNFDDAVLPYDDSVVMVSPATQFRTRSRPNSDEKNENTPFSQTQQAQQIQAGAVERKYVNASRIFDADPRQVAYIAAQAPLADTVADFWQAIWQEGVVVIVNLTDWSEVQGAVMPVRYWPREEEGSKVFGALEVNLVSEHSFNQDYVVRSIYLKNLNTGETRTVTQFHYVAWKDGGLPRSIETLLEFRRKVNKSYRGHAFPVLVHCTNGAGRTGAYILIDLVMNRILKVYYGCLGVKEMNIAASLEHLRDQRPALIENEAQYKLVFHCVAEEVSTLLKNLQH